MCNAMQVIAHTHYNPIASGTSIAKRIIPMSSGDYNWTLAEEAHGRNLYFACSPSDDSPNAPSNGTDIVGLTFLLYMLYTSSWLSCLAAES